MPKRITQYELLISCPGDVKDEINIIHEVVSKFNSEFSNALEIMIQERHWSKDAYPATGDKPQAILNKQFVDDCDAAVAIFWTRFGTPTDEYGSGSEEEIEKMIKSGKNVFMYFSKVSLPADEVDYEQFEKVKEFKKKFKDKGLYWEYSTTEEFKELLYAHLTQHFLSMAKVKELTNEKRPEIKVNLIDAETGADVTNDKTYAFKYPNGLITYRELTSEDIFDEIKELVTVEDIEAYNEALPSKDEIDVYNKQQKLYEDVQNNCYDFSLSVSNIGNTKANEIFVDLKFPKEILVYRENDAERVKQPDKTPDMPRNPIWKAMDEKNKKQMQKFNRGIDSFMMGNKLLQQVTAMSNFSNSVANASFVSPILANYKPLLPTNVDYFVKDNNALSLHIDNLLHTRRYNSNNFSLVFTKCGEFEVEYSVMCEEWEEPIEGCFKLKSEY